MLKIDPSCEVIWLAVHENEKGGLCMGKHGRIWDFCGGPFHVIESKTQPSEPPTPCRLSGGPVKWGRFVRQPLVTMTPVLVQRPKMVLVDEIEEVETVIG